MGPWDGDKSECELVRWIAMLCQVNGNTLDETPRSRENIGKSAPVDGSLG
jgi:hypothetical protein